MSQFQAEGAAASVQSNGAVKKGLMRVDIPKHDPNVHDTEALRTPKTPQNEGLIWFESYSGTEPVQVYELPLEADGGPNKDRAYTRLPPPATPYILRISLEAGTPVSKGGVLKTNFPLYGGAFERSKFVEKTLPSDLSKPIQIDLPISSAGVFVYWIEYDASDGTRAKGREGYFNVDPVLRTIKRTPILDKTHKVLPPGEGAKLTNEVTHLPLDGLSIITLVSKWMGTLEDWKPFYKEASDRGYNMVHYTPLQQRGQSMSPYSIADQMAYDRELFDKDYKGSKEDGALAVFHTLKMAREEYGLTSLTDVVLNHTADNSPWLQEHPEAGFNPVNSPHLTIAVEIDDAMIEFSGSLEANDLPTEVKSEADLNTIMGAFEELLKSRNLWQYYVLDVTKEKLAVREALTAGEIPAWSGPSLSGKSAVEIAKTLRSEGKVQNLGAFSSRFCVYVDPKVAVSALKAAHPDKDDGHLCEEWAEVVNVLNVPQYEECNEDIKVALDNIRNRVKYIRLDENGPKLGQISVNRPLVETYFTRLPQNATTAKHDPRSLSLANNGWIWAANPLENFAERPSKAYLRREVIVWSDCVKLNYGRGPEDNPWLWKHITDYVTLLAGTFDGFRIDNCHSTPLHVGCTLLDAARVVNPDLYICAELFTGSEEMDVRFVSRLGISSLIREAYNAGDPKEMSRLLYRHGVQKPIGSMDGACMTSPTEIPPPTGKGPTRPGIVTPLQGSVPHALFFDLTHDNESPLHKRSAEDALSTGGLIAFSSCAVGSVKGFDDLYPKLLDLVGENRRYELSEKGGIGSVKRILNDLHTEMALEGFSEAHVHQENDYIVIHRVEPKTQRGYILVAHTAFQKGGKDAGYITPIRLRRTKAKFIFGASIEIPSYENCKDPNLIKGLESELSLLPPVSAQDGSDGDGPYQEIAIPSHFPPGSVMLFATQLEGLDPRMDDLCKEGVEEAFAGLDLMDLNVILYRCEGEERDATDGVIGAYDVPGLGKQVYCGLQGWMAPLKHVMQYNDLGHPLCAHLRSGSWAMDYIHSRLEKQIGDMPNLAIPAKWFKERFEPIKTSVPSFLRPKYFAIVVSTAYKAARRAVIEQSSDFIASGHSFTQDLALSSVQMYGLVKSASLDPGKVVPSLAAGLPHFTAGWARTWGRDVFISLRGLFLTTGNYTAAKQHILAFSSTLKHGLIPNLLDSVRNPRYNSRDSPWWMLQNIQDYTLMAPDGLSILSEEVKRRFPKDDTWVPWDDPAAYSYSNTVAEIIQEVLQRHASGISFREHNAGPNLDMQMKDEGFQIDIRVDWKTGLIHGGSEHNCGTWMDKMGESEKAGTKGKPGTPRDGSPVEITGLLKSTLRWLSELSQAGKFPFKGVEATVDGECRLVTYKEWDDLLQASFEFNYYVPLDPAEDASYNIIPSVVNRRGIYKDVVGSGPGREWSDYQLRPNFPIAMVVAPELFDVKHALAALQLTDNTLRAPLGMKTLDPNDLQYRGNYDNSNDSTDAHIAKGLNYHQGPEWGWPLGYFLRAYLYFEKANGTPLDETLHHLLNILLPSRHHIRDDPWAGLPELTNENGAYCHDSCRTQAWSNSTLLDFLHDVHHLSTHQ
ncbi:glycoside hydrolase family 13 protein [Serendipita vermifera MAFF 305830]|uniref:Glycogen debranching enzyme n=1 Tax=Serendipita vermifera MAFF 305830 TaxID=933852 RepID=A0A0C3BSZ1_SERVB|nr:glycoside hydrolase family 13 protein [Serendipita vermifera MAFF 305830]